MAAQLYHRVQEGLGTDQRHIRGFAVARLHSGPAHPKQAQQLRTLGLICKESQHRQLFCVAASCIQTSPHTAPPCSRAAPTTSGRHNKYQVSLRTVHNH